jgi:hypothetical protein
MDFTKAAALAAQAAANGVDMTKAQSGGGDYTPPAAGPCRLRFIGYVELGKHEKEFQGKKSFKEQVELTFEVSGPKHPPREVDGVKYPHIITIRETKSLSDKARFFKLVQLLNYAGKAKHVAELLGQPFRGEIIHRTYRKSDGSEGVAAELYNKAVGTYTISPARIEDPETGDYKALPVDPPISPVRCFLWDYADMDQWASIFIDGQYEERKDKDGKVTAPAKSKNVIQNKIKVAHNFAGSPIATLLAANGQPIDLPESERPGEEDEPPFDVDEKPQTSGTTPDPLAGIA